MSEWLTNIWRSRLVKLTLSMLMLTLSILMFADFFKLRGDPQATTLEARKSIAEALAVQLTVMAGSGDAEGYNKAIEAFVTRSADIAAVSLARADGTRLAARGDVQRFTEDKSTTAAHFLVPIYHQERVWGEVRVAFEHQTLWQEQITYFGFIALSCLVLYLLFLNKALKQIDPSQVVPGRVNHAFNLLSDGVIILDTNLQIMLANDSMAELMGRSAKDLMGQNIEDWPWVRGDDWVSPWAVALETGTYASDEPMSLRVDDSNTRSLMVNCAAVGSEENRTRGLLITFDDLTPIEEKNQALQEALKLVKRSQESIQKKNRELEELATKDPLTGAYNRRALLKRLAMDFAKAGREGRPLSVIMVDIDHFKSINDTHGHVVGDDVIRAVATTLGNQCREYDLVGRYGGEEFLLLLPDLDAEESREVAERLRLAIEAAVADFELPLESLSASLGVADVESGAEDYMALIDNADQALYAAKQSGRNRACVYDGKITKLHAEHGATQEVVTPDRSESQP